MLFDPLPPIPEGINPLDYLGILFIIAGFILVAAGIEVIKIEKITIRPGKKTLIVGILVVSLGTIFLWPRIIDVIRVVPISTPTPIIATTFTPEHIDSTYVLTQIFTPTAWPLNSGLHDADSTTLCKIEEIQPKELGRENPIGITFNVGQRGYCVWKILLNGYNASTKKQITFFIKGKEGGEEYKIGIKDKITFPGQEPKISETASTSWMLVSIPLDKFIGQDLSSLDNVSLSIEHGSGIIYIDQLIFVP